jgi:hypothetical protein
MLGIFWNLVVSEGYPQVPHGAVALRNDGHLHHLHYFEQFSNYIMQLQLNIYI